MSSATRKWSPRRRARGDGGFILAATLWALAALTVLAGYISGVADADVERAQAQRQALQDELDARGTENTLIYLLASTRRSHRGMILEQEQRFSEPGGAVLRHPGDGTIPMSREAHKGLGRVLFALQDERGLFGINSPRQPFLGLALEHVGVRDLDVRRLMPLIADYIDMDNEIAMGGAERYDYARSRRSPPPNWFMVGTPELKRVLGFEGLISADQWRRLRPLLTPRVQIGYNFNTMSPAAVAALVGGEEAAQLLIEEREERVIRTLEEVADMTGRILRLDPDEMLVFPSPNTKVAVWTAGSSRRSILGVRLTAGSPTAPWRKEYRYSERIDSHPRQALVAATPLFQTHGRTRTGPIRERE